MIITPDTTITDVVYTSSITTTTFTTTTTILKTKITHTTITTSYSFFLSLSDLISSSSSSDLLMLLRQIQTAELHLNPKKIIIIMAIYEMINIIVPDPKAT